MHVIEILVQQLVTVTKLWNETACESDILCILCCPSYWWTFAEATFADVHNHPQIGQHWRRFVCTTHWWIVVEEKWVCSIFKSKKPIKLSIPFARLQHRSEIAMATKIGARETRKLSTGVATKNGNSTKLVTRAQVCSAVLFSGVFLCTERPS